MASIMENGLLDHILQGIFFFGFHWPTQHLLRLHAFESRSNNYVGRLSDSSLTKTE